MTSLQFTTNAGTTGTAPPLCEKPGGVYPCQGAKMLTIGIILLIIGVITVILAALTPIPPPIGTLGWIALAIGVVLIILALLLPALSTAPTYAAK